jgi:hypothetical protein
MTPRLARLPCLVRRAGRGGLVGIALLVPGGLVAIDPGAARADVYQVFSCSQPDGRPAPTDGWVAGSVGDVGPYSGDSDTCAQGGALGAVASARVQQNAYAGPEWVFSAPGGERIAGGTLTATFTSPQGQAWLGSPTAAYDPADVLGNCQYNLPCGAAGSLTGVFPIVHTGGSNIYAVAVCVGSYEGALTCPAGSGVDASVSIRAADIALTVSSTPSASAVGGSLTGGEVLDGPQDIQITASDNGPGIYQALFQIDGTTVQRQVIDPDGGRCREVGQTSNGTPAFLYLQPCLTQVNAQDISFDPSTVSDGPHQLRVLVSDAAGDTTTILDRPVVIDNNGAYSTLLARGQCNGITCDDHAQLIAATSPPAGFTRHLARSGVSLTGRLVDHTGTPITAAQVQLLEQPAYAGAVMKEIASATSGPDGAWSFKVPKGPSRLLRVAYFSHLKDAGPAAQLDYRERVYGAISMRAAHRVHLGAEVVFHGRLAGGYIPYPGQQVQMEIYYHRRWRTIEVLPTNRHGRFAYRYIFTLGPGTTYAFRAVVLANPAYPFLAAATQPVKIKVLR